MDESVYINDDVNNNRKLNKKFKRAKHSASTQSLGRLNFTNLNV